MGSIDSGGWPPTRVHHSDTGDRDDRSGDRPRGGTGHRTTADESEPLQCEQHTW